MLDKASAPTTPVVPRPGTTVVELFRRQVSANPAAAALLSDGGVVSYRELEDRSNRLARYLRSRGAGPGTRVAVELPRSVDLVVALLAAQKAGAAYVPVDPGYPAERRAYVLDDVEAVAVVDAATLADPAVAEFPAEDLPDGVEADDPLYILHTSGSTGRPKGVVVPVRAVVNFLLGMQDLFDLGPGDRLLAVTTPSFDISVLEVYLPLVTGASVVIAGDTRDPASVAAAVRAHGVTHLQATPSLWRSLVAAVPDAVRGLRMLVGGEALPPALAERMVELGASVHNLYGPTETTVWSTADRVRAGEAPTIGTPIRGTSLHVLDERMEPVPDGEPGELHIGGAGVALGYWRRPELTEQRFPTWRGLRVYRTGDLVRRRPDGRLDYLGRTDDQVKVRGFRVEPGEVEAALAAHPDVDRAAVTARADTEGFTRLVGYVVPAVADLDLAAVRAHAAATLPAHMVPSILVPVDDFPLTPNGKLDRKALPDPVARATGGRRPATEREAVLCALFADLLGRPEAAADDDFFELGGHSLLAARLVTGIRARLGVEVPVSAVFEHPTAEALAAHLGTVTAPPRPPVRRVDAPWTPLSPVQRGLWLLNRFEEPSAQYNVPLVLRLTGALDVPALAAALVDVVARHEVLRTSYPEVDGEPRQVVGPVPEPSLVAVDTADLDAALAAEASQPFDIEAAPPWRAALHRVAPDEHVLHLVVHHIACDGWSVRPLVEGLAHAYRARLGGAAPQWPEAIRYSDFTAWQQELLDSGVGREQEAFWVDALRGLPAVLDLPALGRRPAVRQPRAGVREVRIGAEVHARAVDLARRTGTTVFMVLQAALSAVLTRCGAGGDVPIGCPVAGRSDDALDGVVGHFVNTVVLRADTSGDPTFSDLLARVRAADLAAFAHQDLPFEHVVRALNPPRSPVHHPLFQVMLTLHNQQPPTADLPGLALSVTEPQPEVSKVDIEFELREVFADDGAPAGITGELVHALDFVAEHSAEGLIAAFSAALDRVTRDPDVRISALEAPELPADDGPLQTEGTAERVADAREAELAALFAEVLGVDELGVDDDFFELGGQSLTAVRLMGRVRAAFAVQLPMRVFLEQPTVAGVLARLSLAEKEKVR
ncbi:MULTISPECIES: amino acid adenylation domain-containing protein [unclassified Saccharothrix]|uniref:amino acid adenylation domain-containing protein n=1 Tax=unclassified Saccharothrix TaxID=2593673 RepID=UPI00307CDC2F